MSLVFHDSGVYPLGLHKESQEMKLKVSLILLVYVQENIAGFLVHTESSN